MKFQARIPMILTMKFLDKLGGEPEGKRILVIRDYGTAVYLAEKNSVTFVTDDVEAAETFHTQVEYNPDYGHDDAVINIGETEWKEFIEELKTMPKFDYAVMNPPYDRNLHLKILEKVIPVANKVVNISPVRWLQDPFAKYLKTSDYKKFEESISKKIETLDIIPAEEATKMFDNAAFTMNLGIYVCGNGGYQYDSETPLVKKIVTKITNSNWSTHAYTKKIKTQLKPYILNVSGIHSKSANHALVCNTYSAQLKTNAPNLKSHNANNHGLFDFDSEIERVNFYNCYTHRFIEYLCTWWRVDVNINSVKVPYFGDYTKPWTTKMFCDYFDITGYIDDEHAVPGSEWEEIMKQW